MIGVEHTQLRTFLWTGTGRSGKGSIVSHLAESHEGTAVEEAGADFRALTLELVTEGILSPNLNGKAVEERVSSISSDQLTEIAASRHLIVEQHGKKALYDSVVTSLVGKVAAIGQVQTSVNAGFKKRVEKVVKDGKANVLHIDHRNARPLVKKIPGLKIVMNTFVATLPIEAAWREIERQGLQVGTPESQLAIMDEFAKVHTRNTIDTEREIDPVVPDEDAIDYWYDDKVFEVTIQKYADDNGIESYTEAAIEMFRDHPLSEYKNKIRYGAGALAVASGRQVYFDTTAFRTYDHPLESMLGAVDVMYDEALITDELLANLAGKL